MIYSKRPIPRRSGGSDYYTHRKGQAILQVCMFPHLASAHGDHG